MSETIKEICRIQDIYCMNVQQKEKIEEIQQNKIEDIQQNIVLTEINNTMQINFDNEYMIY